MGKLTYMCEISQVCGAGGGGYPWLSPPSPQLMQKHTVCGQDTPQGPLIHLELLPDVLQRHLGLPELNSSSLGVLRKVRSFRFHCQLWSDFRSVVRSTISPLRQKVFVWGWWNLVSSIQRRGPTQRKKLQGAVIPRGDAIITYTPDRTFGAYCTQIQEERNNGRKKYKREKTLTNKVNILIKG